MDHNPNFDRIDQYLNNELSERERNELEQQMQQDKQLSAELKRQQAGHQILDMVIAQNLKEQLNTLEAESKVVEMPRKRTFSIYRLAAAASVLLVIGFAAFFLLKSPDNPSGLAMTYYETPDLNAQRDVTVTPDTPDALAQGIDLFKQQQYTAAIATLNTIDENHEQYVPAQYTLGHAYYLTEQYDAAEATFSGVASSGDFRYAEEGTWYALLSCLAQDQICADRLQDITSQPDHTYYQQAQRISEKINI